MDLMPSAEQEAIRSAIRRVLGDRVPTTRLREAMVQDTPAMPELWQEAARLGWFGLRVPPEAGGSGYGTAEAMLLFVELGRTLAPGPWLGTVLAADALAADGLDRGSLDRLLAGTLAVAVADDPEGVLGETERLEGVIDGVADLDAADAVLVVGPRRVGWLLREPRLEIAVRVRPCMDPTRRLGTLRCSGAVVRALAVDAPRLRRLGTLLAAAEALGVAERALEASVEYAKIREQFGRPIGTFQAIKHRCSDMATRTEAARAAVIWAALAIDEGLVEAAEWVCMAKILATKAALENTHDNVQNHGGMGYTWESDAHLFLKRARFLEHAFGGRMVHLDALAAPWRADS